MKNSFLLLVMFTLYWPGTTRPIEQYSNVRIVCGEFVGKKGYVNYTWESGEVDVVYQNMFGLVKHYYVLDYRCLELQ